MKIKNIFLSFIVNTNFTPFSTIYRITYDSTCYFFTKLLIFKFKDSLESLYIKGSYGQKRYIPGISDIDFIVILKTEINEENKIRFKNFFITFSKILPIIEKNSKIWTRDELIRDHMLYPIIEFRNYYDQQSAKLIYGTDIIKQLPYSPKRVKSVGLLDEYNLRFVELRNLIRRSSLTNYDKRKLHYNCEKFIKFFANSYSDSLPQNNTNLKLTKEIRRQIMEDLNFTHFKFLKSYFKNSLEINYNLKEKDVLEIVNSTLYFMCMSMYKLIKNYKLTKNFTKIAYHDFETLDINNSINLAAYFISNKPFALFSGEIIINPNNLNLSNWEDSFIIRQ